MKINAAYRLRADAGHHVPDAVQKLKDAMSLAMGKGMKIQVEDDGVAQVVYFHPQSSTFDLGAADLARLERAVMNTQAVMSIGVNGGKPYVAFEIRESRKPGALQTHTQPQGQK